MIKENKLKEYRNLRSLTQEELAKSSGISIRTIQRIEKGLSKGSPHTIKALAKILNVENADLIPKKNNSTLLEKKGDIGKLKLMNFSILTMIFIPFGNLIFPSIIYYTNKEDEKINTIGRKILSFQILSILLLPFFMIFMSLILGRGNGQIPIGIAIPYLLYLALNIIITIRTAININDEKEILKHTPNIL